jgi:hypothetical protein
MDSRLRGNDRFGQVFYAALLKLVARGYPSGYYLFIQAFFLGKPIWPNKQRKAKRSICP